MSVELPRPERDEYWNDDQPLTTIRLAGADAPVWARSHIAPERYRGSGSETLFRLSSREGERTYVQSRLYIPVPRPAMRKQRLADAQAWHYGADRTIVLWELIASSPLWRPDSDPREDFVLRSLWLAYERFLVARFPTAEQLLTTWEDNPYERADWQGFLTTMGYHQTGDAAFSKPIPSTK